MTILAAIRHFELLFDTFIFSITQQMISSFEWHIFWLKSLISSFEQHILLRFMCAIRSYVRFKCACALSALLKNFRRAYLLGKAWFRRLNNTFYCALCALFGPMCALSAFALYVRFWGISDVIISWVCMPLLKHLHRYFSVYIYRLSVLLDI